MLLYSLVTFPPWRCRRCMCRSCSHRCGRQLGRPSEQWIAPPSRSCCVDDPGRCATAMVHQGRDGICKGTGQCPCYALSQYIMARACLWFAKSLRRCISKALATRPVFLFQTLVQLQEVDMLHCQRDDHLYYYPFRCCVVCYSVVPFVYLHCSVKEKKMVLAPICCSLLRDDPLSRNYGYCIAETGPR